MPRLSAEIRAEIASVRSRLRTYVETGVNAPEAAGKATSDLYRHAADDIELLLGQISASKKAPLEELNGIRSRLRAYRRYCADSKTSRDARRAAADLCRHAADDIKLLLGIVDPPKKRRGRPDK